MSTEKPEQESMPGLADRLAAARKRTEKATNGTTEVSKEAVAGGITATSKLYPERERIGADLDELIDLVGDTYRRLVENHQKIGSVCFNEGKAPPPWIAEILTAEVIMSRLAREIAPHSSGGANESSVGRVRYRDSILCTFQKNHGTYVKERS